MTAVGKGPALRIAIAGRPNAGKSTLFNRLLRRKKAIVDPTPGVTRDENRAELRRRGRLFELIDTGGIEAGEVDERLAARVHQRSESVLRSVDVVVYLLDGKAGLSPADAQIAQRIRALGLPSIFAVNKIDRPEHEGRLIDFLELGQAEVVPVSAAHGRGVEELWQRIDALAGLPPDETDEEQDEEGRGVLAARRAVSRAKRPAGRQKEAGRGREAERDGAPRREDPAPPEPPAGEADGSGQAVRFAFLGRPNVGKSSLLNALAGFERVLVDPTPGTTRDAIDLELERGSRRYVVVDTAGLRRKSRIVETLESRAVGSSLQALDRAEVVVLVVEADQGITDQDLRLADLVWRRGRGLVIAVNKSDLAPRLKAETCREILAKSLPQWPPVPVLLVSAARGRGLDALLRAVDQVATAWRRRLPTARVNDAVHRAAEAVPPPLASGRTVKLMYSTQTTSAPPTVVVFVSQGGALAESYQRYLTHRLREEFGLVGVPLRVQIRARPRRAMLGPAPETPRRGSRPPAALAKKPRKRFGR